MNASLIALELRKNRLTLIGLGAGFALIPPLSFLVARVKGLDAPGAFGAGIALWTIVGLPLSSVFLGATAGAGLRSAESREAEAPLPGSPTGRVLRGFAGAFIQFLILALATGLVSSAIDPAWSGTVLGAGEAPRVWADAAPMRGLLLFLALDLLAASFFAAYAVGHALAGGLLGAALVLAEILALALGLQCPLFFPDRAEPFAGLAVLAALAGLLAKLASARPLAARFERSRPLGFGGAAAAVLLLAAGPLVSWGAEECGYARLRSSLRLLKPGLSTSFLYIGPSAEDAHAALSPAARGAGALATTVGGGLFSLGSDGRAVRLLPDADVGRFSLFTAPLIRVEAAVFDRTGRLFAQRRTASAEGGLFSESDEWLVGRPASGLRRIASDRGAILELARQDGTVGVVVYDKAFKRVFCAVDDGGRLDDCAPKREESALPQAAAPSKDGTALARPGPHARAWRLPGRTDDRGPLAPFLLEGKPAYFVTVLKDEEESVSVCREDGSVKTYWKHGYSGVRRIGGTDLEVLPDGTLVYQYAYDWNVVDPAGNFLPPIRSKRLFERWPRPAGARPHTPRLVHRAGGRAWVLFEAERLVELDEGTGMPVRDWALPVRWDDVHGDSLRVLESGLVLQEKGSLFFVGWDGTSRALRAAR